MEDTIPSNKIKLHASNRFEVSANLETALKACQRDLSIQIINIASEDFIFPKVGKKLVQKLFKIS